MIKRQRQSGFILPSILVISITIIAVMVGLLVVGSSSYKGGYTDHYQKLSDQAAEAGSAYATACLTLSSHEQTWGPAEGRPNLTPSTDCSGANTYSANAYVYSDSTLRTYFAVGDLDYSEPFSAQISATGYVDVLRPDGSIIKTYSSIQKKIITWPTDIEGQMSASGTNRTCAIVNYQVYCWGYNAYGQLGNGLYLGTGSIESGSTIDSLVPVKVRQDPGVMAGKRIAKIVVAQHHSCALSEDGLMYCWGYNGSGQLGNGTTVDSPVPVQVSGALAGKVVTDIGGTNDSTCAISEGKIYCWGSNTAGVTGRTITNGQTISPTLVDATNTSNTLPTNYTATMLSTSGSRGRVMCAVVSGLPYCWGQNNAGSVGDNSTTTRTVPYKVAVLSGGLLGRTVTSISVDGYTSDPSDGTGGYPHVCAVASGRVFCWGENRHGQLGDGTTTDRYIPTAVNASGVLNGLTIQDVKVGLRHSCVRANNGAYCWGLNNSGQVADNTSTNRSAPVAVYREPGALTASNVVSIGAGANRGCAVVTDGRTFCWGVNNSGQIGDGTKVTRRIPTESLFLRPVGNQYIF